MAEKTIKHLQFWYVQSYDDPISKQTVQKETIAYQGDTVEISSDADLARGEELGAFYTDAELAAFSGEAPDEGGGTDELTAPDLVTASTDDVADWMDETGATIDTLLEMVNGSSDPETAAKKVLDAENIARSGDPRKGLVEGLTTVMERSAS
jgi:hypothetical protein